MIRAWFSVYKLAEVETMASLAEDNRAARALGLSYGIYKSEQYKQNHPQKPQPPSPPARRSRRRYTDEEVFAMWQAGMNDCEIGASLGVSRQIIQRWRDTMELPSTAKQDIDTSRYRLIRTPRGMYVMCGEE